MTLSAITLVAIGLLASGVAVLLLAGWWIRREARVDRQRLCDHVWLLNLEAAPVRCELCGMVMRVPVRRPMPMSHFVDDVSEGGRT